MQRLWKNLDGWLFALLLLVGAGAVGYLGTRYAHVADWTANGRVSLSPQSRAVLSKLVHLALYAFFIVMPLLGMATAWSDGKAILIPFTGVALPALLPENRALAHQLEDLHGTIGEVFYWVIGAHVLAAIWHHAFRRDDTLKRML